MVQIVSPEKDSREDSNPFYKIAAIVLAVALMFNLALLFYIKADTTDRRRGVSDAQLKIKKEKKILSQGLAALEPLEKKVQKLESDLGRLIEKFSPLSERVKQLEKENQVLLLNNQDFIKMFEAIQDDLDKLRERGVLISYKADAGSNE